MGHSLVEGIIKKHSQDTAAAHFHKLILALDRVSTDISKKENLSNGDIDYRKEHVAADLSRLFHEPCFQEAIKAHPEAVFNMIFGSLSKENLFICEIDGRKIFSGEGLVEYLNSYPKSQFDCFQAAFDQPEIREYMVQNSDQSWMFLFDQMPKDSTFSVKAAELIFADKNFQTWLGQNGIEDGEEKPTVPNSERFVETLHKVLGRGMLK